MSTEIAWTNFIYSLEEDSYFHPLLPLAKLAAQDEIINKFYPFTSHEMMGLSSTQVYGYPTGHPPTVALPHATAQSYYKSRKPLASFGMYVDWPGKLKGSRYRIRKIADGEAVDIVAIWRCLECQKA